MLEQRILTAVLLVPPFIAALFYFSPTWIAVLLGIFIAAAAWEWAVLTGLDRFSTRIAYTLCLLGFGAVGVQGLRSWPSLMVPVLIAAVLWWLWAMAELIYQKDVHRGLFATRRRRMVGGFFVLTPAWLASAYLPVVDPGHPRVLLFLFVLVWVADTAAYFAGSVFGKTKLAPHISPGKTVEGVLGGSIAVALLAWICGTMIWHYDAARLAGWIGLAAITVLFSVAGDLTESKLKRIAKVKDSGRILPGHGGVLDRIDALTAAAPIFVLGWIILSKLDA